MRSALLISASILLNSACSNGPGEPAGRVSLSFDFADGDLGWVAGFADYPEGEDEFYELLSDVRALPGELGIGATGVYIQGNNHSDDLFMFIKKELGADDGLVPEGRYRATFDIHVASNAQTGCFGVGGAPGEGVVLKAGASALEPRAVADASGQLLLNVDKGNQSVGGAAASVVSDIANGLPCAPEDTPYVLLERTHLHSAVVTAAADGTLWLLVGTDSGFEATTALYYVSIDVTLEPVE